MPVGHSLLIGLRRLPLTSKPQPHAHLAPPQGVGYPGTPGVGGGEGAPGRSVRAQEPFPLTVNPVRQMGELTLEGESDLPTDTKSRTWTLVHICQGTSRPPPRTPGGVHKEQLLRV